MHLPIELSLEVSDALENGRPVVALESTIITHGTYIVNISGMEYPVNVSTAIDVEKQIRDNGAVPATIAIMRGRIKVGLTAQEIE